MGFRGVKPYQISQQMGEDREEAAQKRLLAQQGQQSDYEREIAHDATQSQDAFVQGSQEGESANGIGGDPTANLPDRIAGQGVAVRPDVEKFRSQYHSEADAERLAISRARQMELDRTEREINLKADSMRPGETPVQSMSDVTYTMDTANRHKWEKMRDASLEMAQQEHDAKYGLLGGGANAVGLGRVVRM